MLFEKKYKIKDLYVARLGRITEEKFVNGKTIWECGIHYYIDYDGPIGIFVIDGKKAKQITTGVEYYKYDGIIRPKKWEWFVNKSSPITHYYKFKDGITSLTKKQVDMFEQIFNEKNNNKKENNTTENN